jgi:2-hydroxy-6-oxonona-2,4-dienedioate hydrolase
LVQSGFRVIVMPRFGYLRTPLPVDASAAAQADAQPACSMRLTSGAPSSMQFAL